LLVLNRISPNFPLEITTIIKSFLPSLFYGGLLFRREVKRSYKCAGDEYEKTVLKFHPNSQRFLFVEEIDNSNASKHTVVAHSGTFSLKNSRLVFSVESSEGYQKQTTKDSYTPLSENKLREEIVKFQGENENLQKMPECLNYTMKNDLKNGGLKIVTSKYTLTECTADEAKLIHETTVTLRL